MNWGIFANSLITFLIVAFALFMVIKGFNKMKREEEEAPEPTAEETLLTQIRDILKVSPLLRLRLIQATLSTCTGVAG